jgi:CheY-like chemotaxis protein
MTTRVFGTALRGYLESEGYDVAAAEDGVGALLQLGQTTPDVIVSDLNMPRMSGFELLSVVRRRFPQILIVAMSGAYNNSDELPPEVIADGYYPKGQDPESLFGVLAQLLRTVSGVTRDPRGPSRHPNSASAEMQELSRRASATCRTPGSTPCRMK